MQFWVFDPVKCHLHNCTAAELLFSMHTPPIIVYKSSAIVLICSEKATIKLLNAGLVDTARSQELEGFLNF